MGLIYRMKRLTKKFLGHEDYVRIKKDGAYCYDGLFTYHNHDFMKEPSFEKSYSYSVEKVGKDYQWYWRTHIGMTVALWAMNRGGAFAECGVGKGAMSTLVLKKLSLHYNKLPPFYLFDTFDGIDSSLVSQEEEAFWGRSKGEVARNNKEEFGSSMDEVYARYSSWPNVKIFKGSVPSVLIENCGEIVKNRFSFLHIDMNNATPEAAAVDFFIDKLTSPAFFLFDDYAYNGYTFQKYKIDEIAKKYGFHIASLPTGQGLAIVG